jgi:pSer/pThr/pTyr-binding forkhead associated (FHA) protein
MPLPDPDAVVCPRCGTGNPSRLKYCAVCGTGLPASGAAGPPMEVPAPSTQGPAPTPHYAAPVAPPAPAYAAPVAPPYAAPEPPRMPSVRPQVGQAFHCWRCSTPVVAHAAFCQACGAELVRAGGSGATPPPARLVVIAQDGSTEREYAFDSGQLDIGRHEGDVVLADDAYVCPRHARILWKNGQFWISDLGSVNGVYARLKAAEPLQHGDLVLLGLEVLRFELVNVDEQAQVAAVERGTRLFGSPAAPRYARLVQRTVEGVSRNVYYISHTRTAIGRESGDIVFTDDPFMSRQHAAVTRQYDGSFLLADNGSSNGTFLSIRGQRPLNDGDDVRIGQHLFRLKVRT